MRLWRGWGWGWEHGGGAVSASFRESCLCVYKVLLKPCLEFGDRSIGGKEEASLGNMRTLTVIRLTHLSGIQPEPPPRPPRPPSGPGLTPTLCALAEGLVTWPLCCNPWVECSRGSEGVLKCGLLAPTVPPHSGFCISF